MHSVPLQKQDSRSQPLTGWSAGGFSGGYKGRGWGLEPIVMLPSGMEYFWSHLITD